MQLQVNKNKATNKDELHLMSNTNGGISVQHLTKVYVADFFGNTRIRI